MKSGGEEGIAIDEHARQAVFRRSDHAEKSGA